MPLYEIQHTIPLSTSQQEALAKAITKVHTETFIVPRLLVNVRFTDMSFQPHYAAGEKKNVNLIIAYLRDNASRTEAAYNDLCNTITNAWTSVVGKSGAEELRGVIIQGSVIAGIEAGFPIPRAGEDKLWLKRNYEAFRKLAEEGHEDFVGVLREIEERADLKEVLE